MTASMEGKVCLVTGATSGIGEAAALEIARMGATTILVGRSQEKCEAAAARIRQETGQSPDYLLAGAGLQGSLRPSGCAAQ